MLATAKKIDELSARADRLAPSQAGDTALSLLESRRDVYRADPALYCAEILRVQLTPVQVRICGLIVTPPYRVLCASGHNIGKSFLAACLVNWWYDVHNPGICITTAPSKAQVNSILWAEVRRLRQHDRSAFAGPKISKLQSAEHHWAEGITSASGTGFQGHHTGAVMVVIDEAEGVDPSIWEASDSMVQGDHRAFFAIYNPTTSGSTAAQEERKPGCHRVSMSCIDHPNIAAELAGERPPYPTAVRLDWVRERLVKWCEQVPDNEELPGDVRLDGKLWRPGPVAESRLLGRRPSTAFNAVWSDALFDRVCARELPEGGFVQIGCDVARFGDDDTAIHVRRGGHSFHHESANGRTTDQTEDRLKMLAWELGDKFRIDPKQILIAVDDTGVGGGVTDHLARDGWLVVGVNAQALVPGANAVQRAATCLDSTEYARMRDKLWFEFKDACVEGNVSFALLPQAVRDTLRRELCAPTYTLDVRGRRCVEAKADTKDRLGGQPGDSPDNADAVHLAYCALGVAPDRVAGRVAV